jgi:hypothetical protein
MTVPPVISASLSGDHCREMANRLRELARMTHSPGRELINLAKRYDRRDDHFDHRSEALTTPML